MLRIVEIHPAETSKLLNSEWFVVENVGDTPFNTRNCALARSFGNSKKRKVLGTLDPGFTIAPGEKVRIITGNPGRKAHGKQPSDGIVGYSLFLNNTVLKGAGTVLTLQLRSHALTSAEFDPKSDAGVAAAAD